MNNPYNQPDHLSETPRILIDTVWFIDGQKWSVKATDLEIAEEAITHARATGSVGAGVEYGNVFQEKAFRYADVHKLNDDGIPVEPWSPEN